jgi:hypothetical protein
MAPQGRPTKNQALVSYLNLSNILFSSFAKNDIKRPPCTLWFRLSHAGHFGDGNDFSL